MNLSRLRYLRNLLTWLRWLVLTRIMHMDIDRTVEMSLSAKPDMTFPRGVHIGAHSLIAFNVRILTHDRTRGLYLHTRVGQNCFIGGGSIVLPGIEIGDNCVVGAGSVVTRNVPDRSLVAGNPARIVRSDIDVGRLGRFSDADQRERECRDNDPETSSLPDKYLGLG